MKFAMLAMLKKEYTITIKINKNRSISTIYIQSAIKSYFMTLQYSSINSDIVPMNIVIINCEKLLIILIRIAFKGVVFLSIKILPTNSPVRNGMKILVVTPANVALIAV